MGLERIPLTGGGLLLIFTVAPRIALRFFPPKARLFQKADSSMKRSYPWVCRLVLVAASVGAPVALAEEPDRKRGVPTYSNQDLDRVHAQREQLGFASVPAVSDPAGRLSTRPPARRQDGEDFWRRAAEAHRGRVAALERALAELQDKAAAARPPAPETGRKPTAATQPSYLRRIAALQARIHDEEMRFLDRARREGALPGWLR